MKFLAATFFSVIIALATASTANAMAKKSSHKGQNTASIGTHAPSSRAAQEQLTW